jgi:outer membrane lipoprotein SlyB
MNAPLPPGRQPYDALTGARVGGLAGALLGGGLTALLGVGYVWLVALGAVCGAVAGFLWEHARIERERGRRSSK